MANEKRRTRKFLAPRRQRSRRGRRPRFESIEARHLLSAIGLNSDGIVEVEGTEDSDLIEAYVEDGQFVVEVNGASWSVNNEDVDGLYVEAKAGDDTVRIDATVLQPTLIFGGAGNDRMQGGSGQDAILGGSDNDIIYGRTSGDILLGDGPNSFDEVPVPEPGEPELAVDVTATTVVDLVPIDPTNPDPDPLALHKYLSRISGINTGADTIVGGGGNDMIFAGQDADSITGDGADLMPDFQPVEVGSVAVAIANPTEIPLNLDDYIEGGAGDDTVNSGAGKDLVLGGGGNDVLNTGPGADIVGGGNGDDTINTDGGKDVVLGDGPNTVNQAILDADDIYKANSALGFGDDYIEAGDGDDTVYAGHTSDAGVNLVFGGAGNDNLYGGAGHDAIVGGDGDDMIASGASADTVLGDSANSLAEMPVPVPGEPPVVDLAAPVPLIVDIAPIDPPDPLAIYRYLSRVAGINSGSDTIVAGTGNDLVFSGDEADRVEGDGANVYATPTLGTAALAVAANGLATPAPIVQPPGDDYIESGLGDDVVDAGYGNNIVLGGGGHDTLTSGAGNDSVAGGNGDDVIRTGGGADKVLGDGPGTINQAITDVEDVYLANSELGSGNDFIESGAGADMVWAGRGADTVFAGAGDDFAHGGPGADLLVGGTGADTLIGGGGDDVIVTGGPNARPSPVPASDLAEALANDASLTGDQSNDYVEAGRGDDRVFAFGGHELVFGGMGDDAIRAGAGHDAIAGGDGNDTISSGAGDDVVLGDGPNSFDDAILPMPDADVRGDNWTWLWTVWVNSMLGTGDDVLDGGAGFDWLFAGAGADLLFGRAGNDILHGGIGDDELHDDLNSEGSGADVFIGDAGADKIFANDGPGGPVDWIFYDIEDEIHADGEDMLILMD